MAGANREEAAFQEELTRLQDEQRKAEASVTGINVVELGNAQAMANNAGGEDNKPLKTSSVHVRLMENSLAARDAASPQGAASTTGAERP